MSIPTLVNVDFQKMSNAPSEADDELAHERNTFALQILCALLQSRPSFSDQKCCLYAYAIADTALEISKLSKSELKEQIRNVGFR